MHSKVRHSNRDNSESSGNNDIHNQPVLGDEGNRSSVLCMIRSAKITASAMMLHNYYDPIEGLTSCTSRTKPNIKLGFFVWRSALFKEQKRFWLVPVSGYTCTIFNEMSFSDTSFTAKHVWATFRDGRH